MIQSATVAVGGAAAPKRVTAEDAMNVFAGVFDVPGHRGSGVLGVLAC
jgi:hypothetical protein